MSFSFLLHGHDTVHCAYYLQRTSGHGVDFEMLTLEKEKLRQSKMRDPKHINLGGMDFLLHGYGSSSGFPFVISNRDFNIQLGENNTPNFYVTFPSEALWRKSVYQLHAEFMEWASALGYCEYKSESLSRVDFSFDYHVPEIDFDEDSFISLSSKDSQYRQEGVVQTFNIGKGDIVLRVYNKIDEIEQKSEKVWFFDLWNESENVWRIEWQVRKDKLRRFGIRTFSDLSQLEGDLLRYLATEHTTLRIKANDSNRSRWPLHPLWIDLQDKIENMNCLGVDKCFDEDALLEEKELRIAISMYGYMKRIAALYCLRKGSDMVSKSEAIVQLDWLLSKVHDPLSWQTDVKKKTTQMRLGKW
ncbi:hypothetical protein D8Y20_13345 [Mariprofundus sp. EBB-1]|uniref:hypothetical protein n=1 Tax=Mariprofundus sp. EBB-1 TaxID=2650971 RepID=UPI000EF1C9E9|nr:hypothetical protein [Mariprofundus sp. EBB-1]RLL49115.1 hypothetical protein D8Y20_13345 [Mariprofundus sp. EBB-1]